MRQIVYTFSVTATVPIEEDAGEDAYTNRKEIRALEVELIKAVGSSKYTFGAVDAECMGHEITEIRGR